MGVGRERQCSLGFSYLVLIKYRDRRNGAIFSVLFFSVVPLENFLPTLSLICLKKHKLASSRNFRSPISKASLNLAYIH